MNLSPNYTSYFRPEIDAIDGYTPGEQPQTPGLIKLNTNENPYPPSPRITALLKSFDTDRLRLYPDPCCQRLRKTIAEIYGCQSDNVLIGNGSDDLLTIIFRSFTDKTRPMACLEPTYSLYPVLADIQGTPCIRIPLTESFALPEDILKVAEPANLLIICRPNAPTGNLFSLDKITKICADFKGIVLIDEAYADFAANNCLELTKKFNHVIVCRTLSKSYSLAGLRLGFAFAHKTIIEGMTKVKDSYNVDMLTQSIAIAALEDQEFFQQNTARVRASRQQLSTALQKLEFDVIPSEANFIFASPPDRNGEKLFDILRANRILVRYFPGPATGAYVRITIGSESQIDCLLDVIKAY